MGRITEENTKMENRDLMVIHPRPMLRQWDLTSDKEAHQSSRTTKRRRKLLRYLLIWM
jgi:aspartate carbamoyltransferase catalytic subunit